MSSGQDHHQQQEAAAAAAAEEEALKALVRVRNRLANTADAALPPILLQLLPRLLSRFQTQSRSSGHSPSDPPHLNDDHSPSRRFQQAAVVEETAGIFAHLYDRLQLNHGVIAHSTWCRALLEKLAALSSSSDDDEDDDFFDAYMAVLPVLEIALLKCRDVMSPATSLASSTLEPLVRILHRLETQLRRADETVYADPFRRVQVEQLESAWARASWMVLDGVAILHGHVSPVLDWQRDLGKHINDNGATAAAAAAVEKKTTANSAAAASALSHSSSGPPVMMGETVAVAPEYRDTLHALFLDVLMFRPNDRGTLTSLSRLAKYRCEFRRRCTFTEATTDATSPPPPTAGSVSSLPLSSVHHNRLVLSRYFGRQNITTVDTWIAAECAHWSALQHGVLRGTTVLLHDSLVQRNGIYVMITGGLPKVGPQQGQAAATRPLVSELVQQMMKRPRRLEHQNTTVGSAVVTCCSLELAVYLMARLVGNDDVDEASRTIIINTKHVFNGSMTLNPNLRAPPLAPDAWRRTFQFLQSCQLDWSESSTPGDDDEKDSSFHHAILRLIERVAKDAAMHVDNKVSMETYALIGSRIPPSLCFEMKTLTSFLDRDAQNHHYHLPHDVVAMIEQERWRCATSMLAVFRADQVRRYRRDLDAERQLTTAERLISRNRERLARNDPFVQHAIQMRLEAYAAVAAYAPRMLNLRAESRRLDWDVAAMSLNCAIHDTRSEVSSRLQEACTMVLECYVQRACSSSTADQADPLQLLYIPIQQACSSSDPWVRSLGCQWATRVLEHYDALFARVVFTCMIHDEDEAIATASVTALSNAPPREVPPIHVATFANIDAVNNEVKVDLRDRIKAIQQFGQLDEDSAFLCLREHQFSVEITRTFLPVPDEAYAPSEPLDGTADAFCGVCFDPVDPEAMGSSLMCCHYFCSSCWTAAIDVAVSDRGLESLVGLTCLRHDCHEKVTSQALSFLAPKWARRWESAMLESFVNNCETYCFCPQSDCTSVAVLPDSTSPVTSATCTRCHTTFCPTCGEGAHSPVPCQVLRDYQTVANRRNAIIDEIENRVQPCPHCGQRIQKNGGCNHMTCTSCGHEFCWLCLSPNWASHVCRSDLNWEVPDEGRNFMTVQQLVLNQEHSEAAESNRLENLDQFMDQLPTRYLWTESDVSVLREACNELFLARKFLKFACVSLYGLHSQDVVREFDEKRSVLQVFVERLSYVVDSVRLATDETALMTAFRSFRFCKAAIPFYVERLEAFLAQCFRRPG